MSLLDELQMKKKLFAALYSSNDIISDNIDSEKFDQDEVF
jgi:hypothetical protein